jgi:glycogen(starch) synthase
VRILFLSNFYPPHDLGGWEQNCQEIADRLRVHGHECYVLTSRHGTGGRPALEDGVSRVLYLQADVDYYQPLRFFLRRPAQERANRMALRCAVTTFHPDVIFVWGMWDLSRQIAYWAEQWLPGRVAYAIASYWLVEPDVHERYWQNPARRSWTRTLMRPAQVLALYTLKRDRAAYPLMLEHVACVSNHVRRRLVNAGALPHGGRVIYNGIDPQAFLSAAAKSSFQPHDLRLVYTGGLVAHKGVHTAVEALGLLQQGGETSHIHLTLVGSGHPEYQAYLRQRVAELGLNDQVTFHGRVPRERIAEILARHDVFLFTSVYEEPIARSVMEAMATGLSVIGTPVGGQREMLENGVNALTFPPNDAAALSACIGRMRRDPSLRTRLAEAGRCTVLDRFTLGRMVDQMETWLAEVAA